MLNWIKKFLGYVETVNDQITDSVTQVKKEIEVAASVSLDRVSKIEKKIEEDLNKLIKKTGITEVKNNKKSVKPKSISTKKKNAK